MRERDGAVVRIALLHQHVAVEAAHLLDREDADAAEGLGGHGQHFAFSQVSADFAFGVALQAVEVGVLPQWKPMKVSCRV